MKVVVDTSGWYAFVAIKDAQHKVAVDFLKNEEHELVIVKPVFIEVTALLQSRQGKGLAVESGEKLIKMGVKSLANIDELEAWRCFEESGKKVSYVDCVVAVVAKKLGLPIFTFDSDFKKLDVEVVPYET